MSEQELKLKISATNTASPEIKALKKDLETIGQIDSFNKLKRQTAESKKEWQNAQAEVVKLARAMKQGGDGADALSKDFEKAKNTANKLKTAYIENRDGLQALRSSLTSTGVDTKNLAAEQQKLRDAVNKTKEVLLAQKDLGVRPYKNIQADIASLRASYDTLKKSGTLSSAELYQAQVKLKEKTAELRQEMGGWAGDLQKAKTGLLALAGAGYLFIKSFQAYSDFSQRMGEVNTLIDVSKERFASLGDEIRALTKEIPQTASELAAAEYDILSAGVALEKSVGVLEKSAKAAVAGVTDTKTAANAGLAVINAYGKSIDDLDNVYDLLFKTVKLGVTTFPELSQQIGNVLPTAKAANIGLTDLTGSLAALTKVGLKTPQAVTALKGAINALAAPTPEAKKNFDALGITWKGLLPTLDAIREKSLSIDQMRLLIPDVEARTGVLALTQNFGVLTDTIKEMSDSSGAMEEAYDKMKDTPANQMKLFKNEIDDLTLSAGALASKALLPLASALRFVIESLREADPATKAFVLSLMGAAAGFALWKLGLGSIITGLGGFIVQIRASQIAVGALNAQFAASSVLMKAGLVGVAAYAGYTVGSLIRLIPGVDEATQSFAAWTDKLLNWTGTQEKANDVIAKTAEQMKKLEEFKDFKLPGDITKAAQSDLEDFRMSLIKARGYYIALQIRLQQKSKETTLLGNATDEAIAAQKELKTVNVRLKEIQNDFKKLGGTASDAAVEMKKPAEAVMSSTEQLDAFEKAAKAAYESAKKSAEEYAKKVIEWEEKIKYAKLSTEDKIRELGQKGMADAAVWADNKLRAEEKFYAAKEALAKGDYALAEKLAKDAEALYAGLATEVKKTENGTEVVSQSLKDTKEIAINGVKSVGDFVQELYTQQKKAAATAQAEWQATADGIKKQLDEIAKQREANIAITLSGVEAAENRIASLIKDEYKTIYVRTVKSGSSSSSDSSESMDGYATGGISSGYGGGDRNLAYFEDGEGIVKKEAVRKYGNPFFYAYNNMKLKMSDVMQLMRGKLPGYGPNLSAALNSMKVNLADTVRARIGGLIPQITIPAVNIPAFAEGGQVLAASGPTESMTLNLRAGNVEAPLTVIGNNRVTRSMVKGIEKEILRMGLSRR